MLNHGHDEKGIIMKQLLLTAGIALSMSCHAAAADEIRDILAGALAAYDEGDVKLAREEAEFAIELMKSNEAKGFVAFLPAPQEGWSLEIDKDQNAMALFGGGVSAVGNYSNGEEGFTITLLANSPMVTSMGAMFNSVATMNAMGELRRIGREKFVISDGSVQGLVDKTIMIQGEGDNTEAIFAHIETMDFKGMKDF